MHISAPVAAHRLVEIVEKAVDLPQKILRKDYGYWPFEVTNAMNTIKTRIITKYGY